MLLFRQVLLLCKTPQIQNNKMVSAQRSYNFSKRREGSSMGKQATWVSMRGMLSTHLLSNACQVFKDKGEVKKSFIAGSPFQE